MIRIAAAITMVVTACGNAGDPTNATQSPHRTVHGAAVAPSTGSDVSATPPTPFVMRAGHAAPDLIGSPCSAARADQVCWLCDTSGRIAGAIWPGDYVYIDESATDVIRHDEGASPRRLVYAIAFEPAGLRAQVLTCPGCRRQIGWAIEVARASWQELSPALRTEIQVSLGASAVPGSLDEIRAKLSAPPARDPIACPSGTRN